MPNTQVVRTTTDLDWLHKLDNEYLLCRALRHQWDINSFRAMTAEDAKQLSRPPGTRQVIVRELHCWRCPTMKVEFFARTTAGKLNGDPFTKFRTVYKYPKGYTFVSKEHDLDRPTHEDYQRETFRRHT